jgi:cell wall-associated NlpC family hydrolase
MAVFAVYGIELPDYGYADGKQLVSCDRAQDVHTAAAFASRDWVQARPEYPVPSLIALKTNIHDPRLISHFGAYVGGGYMVHSMRKLGLHKVKITDSRWVKRIVGVYEYAPE